jgi:hypothetical protein
MIAYTSIPKVVEAKELICKEKYRVFPGTFEKENLNICVSYE